MRYVRSIDGLRAIAIMLVMAVHYHQNFGGGWMGVQLFFVISGFLITGILLDAKAQQASIKAYLARFFVRRSLRIFPLYFGFVAILSALYFTLGLPENWPQVQAWLLTYTLNIGHMLHRVPVDDLYSHLWSLAVEEQFYLIWPFVVWWLSRDALRWLVIAILLLAPVLRAVMIANGATLDQLYFFTPCQLDAFAAGAALQLFELPIKRPVPVLLGVGLLTLVAGVLANWNFGAYTAIVTAGNPYYLPHSYQYIWGYSLLNLTAMLAVFACVKAKLPWLEWSPAVQLGQISYGVYVFHRPVIGLLDQYAPLLPLSAWARGAVVLCLYLGMSYLLARLSYRYFESYFLDLKDRWYPTKRCG